MVITAPAATPDSLFDEPLFLSAGDQRGAGDGAAQTADVAAAELKTTTAAAAAAAAATAVASVSEPATTAVAVEPATATPTSIDDLFPDVPTDDIVDAAAAKAANKSASKDGGKAPARQAVGLTSD